jgi:membrane protein YdbS with pleckstrin-like domain
MITRYIRKKPDRYRQLLQAKTEAPTCIVTKPITKTKAPVKKKKLGGSDRFIECRLLGSDLLLLSLAADSCNGDLEAFAARKEFEIEKPLFSGRPAVIFSVDQIIPFVLLAVATSVLGYFMQSWQQIFFIFVGFLIAGGLVYLRFHLISRSIHYTITTQRIKLKRGLLSKIQETLELFRIDHLELRKPLGKRLLGQASLHLFSSDAELEKFSIYAILGLEELANTLRDCQLRERNRRGLTTFVRA